MMPNRAYPRSWINQLSAWVEKLPGRPPYYYLLLAIILVLFQSLPAWLEGALPWGQFLPAHLFISAATAFILAVVPLFDRKALEVFQAFLPIAKADETQREALRQRLSQLPPLPAIMASLATLTAAVLLEIFGAGPYRSTVLEGYSAAMFLTRAVYFLCWWCYGVFIYHSLRQLSTISQIFSQHTRINVYGMKPVYRFSNLTALTAGSLVLLPYGFWLANPEVSLFDPNVLGVYVVLSLIALVTFILPQLGIHRLQQQERDRLLDRASGQYQSLLEATHASLEKSDHEAVARLSASIQLVEREIKTLKGLSTWPWQPETLRWLFTALVLPLLIWLAQYFLGKYLS